jgi:hypothetical protein
MSMKITVDTSQVRQTVDGMIREAGPARQFILQDAGAYWEIQARKHVHVITGQTKSSINYTVQGKQVNLEASGGAPFEEDKGSPHDFMTQALEDLSIELPRIIDNRLSKVFGGTIFR